MERTFKVGDRVWVYSPPCVQVGKITEVTDYNAVRVHIDNFAYGNDRVHHVYFVYHYPHDASLLEAQLLDDADGMAREAREVINQYELWKDAENDRMLKAGGG